jgi:predicted TIM-barrel fold metal-dependent hydrolase
VNRREFLSAAAAAVTAVGATTALTAPQKTNTRPIDVHYHMWAPEFIKITQENGFPVGPGEPIFWDLKKTPWSLSMAVEHNDKAGVIGMCSVPGSTNWGPKRNLWPRMARLSNEYAAKIRADYPKFFGMWATLPMMDIDASLKEIEYVLDTLKADGFGLVTNYMINGSDKFQGDPIFNPIYEELNRRKAVIYVHPQQLHCIPTPRGDDPRGHQECEQVLPKGVDDSGYRIDTGRAMATLVFTGSTTRYPDISWIFSHGGGTTPSLFGEYMIHREEPRPLPQNYKGTAYEFKKFYYDTAQVYDADEMRLAKSLWSTSHIVFGSDFPYFSAAETVEGVKNCGVFNQPELQAIYYENLHRLVPRLRTV